MYIIKYYSKELFGVKIINMRFLDTTILKMMRVCIVFYLKCVVLGVNVNYILQWYKHGIFYRWYSPLRFLNMKN